MKFNVQHTNHATITLEERMPCDGITLVDVHIVFDAPAVPTPIRIGWEMTCPGAYTTWGVGLDTARSLMPSWRKATTHARLASGAPLHQVVSFDAKSCATIALSDAMTPCSIGSGMIEEGGDAAFEVTLFTQPVNTLSDYHVTIYIDRRPLPYAEALKCAEAYWTEECGYPHAYVPDAARRPMYSCWYSFHQHIDVERILEQCRLAKALGMESVIVDDGWQTDDSNKGYSFCGDWEIAPSKIPDMRAFVDAVHDIGLKFLIWYSVPFIGKASRVYRRFADDGMLLGHVRNDGEANGYACIDPRFPEARAYLVGIYAKAVEAYGFDGLKLDFIDSFKLFPDTPAYDERWDTRSLEEGVDKLLCEIIRTVKQVNPDILIEFRQDYVGPTIRKYGNMMRVADCPADSFRNHINSVDMRYMLGSTPVHSDMLMWTNKDTVESVAHQLACCLFTVPQISVLLGDIPEEHRRALAFYLAFWNEHREVLLDGDFTAENPEALYSLVKAEKDGHIIAVAHAKPMLLAPPMRRLSFFNAGAHELLAVRLPEGSYTYTMYTCMGDIIEQGSCEGGALRAFPVPVCGMVDIVCQ